VLERVTGKRKKQCAEKDYVYLNEMFPRSRKMFLHKHRNYMLGMIKAFYKSWVGAVRKEDAKWKI